MLPLSEKSGKTAFFRKGRDGWLLSMLIPLAVLLGYLLATKMVLGVGLFAGLIGLAILITCMLSVEMGLYINVAYSFFICHFSRQFFNYDIPVGIGSNVLIIATFLGLFGKKYDIRKDYSRFVKSPVIVMFLINIAYLSIELFNPLMHSFDGWYTTIRALVTSALLLFLAYCVFNNYASIRRFIITSCLCSAHLSAFTAASSNGMACSIMNYGGSRPTRYGMVLFL